MKLTKLMLSAFAAAAALVACNKIDSDIPENTSLKSVKLSFENVIMTKGPAGNKIEAGDPVVVNNFKIILTDASLSQAYGAKKDATGSEDATFYFTGSSLSTAPYEFHYVDHKVTKVIAVANMGDITLEQLKAYTESIGNQQDQSIDTLGDPGLDGIDGSFAVSSAGPDKVITNFVEGRLCLGAHIHVEFGGAIGHDHADSLVVVRSIPGNDIFGAQICPVVNIKGMIFCGRLVAVCGSVGSSGSIVLCRRIGSGRFAGRTAGNQTQNHRQCEDEG